jgi:hypothetical protein
MCLLLLGCYSNVSQTFMTKKNARVLLSIHTDYSTVTIVALHKP